MECSGLSVSKSAQHLLIEWSLLAALRLDIKAILEAACDRHHRIVNVPGLLPSQTESKTRTPAKYIRDFIVFPFDNGHNGNYENDEIYIDLGENKQGVVKDALKR